LQQIIKSDEIWIHNHELESKRQGMFWRHSGFPPKKKFKTQQSVDNIMFAVFWDTRGPILWHYTEKGSTINSVSYCEMLGNELKSTIRTKRREFLIKGLPCSMPVLDPPQLD
jgi:hypothetical protein